MVVPLREGLEYDSASERVHMLDNAKAVLIVCVVLYHTAVVYPSADRAEVRGLTINPRE